MRMKTLEHNALAEVIRRWMCRLNRDGLNGKMVKCEIGQENESKHMGRNINCPNITNAEVAKQKWQSNVILFESTEVRILAVNDRLGRRTSKDRAESWSML
jgi:hypothetical protein